MKLWRIAVETRRYAANDISGGGAAINPGRWNEAAEAVLYTAPTIAMAVLETSAHIDDGGLPLNRYLVELEVPPAIWRKRQTLAHTDMPAAWNAIPAGAASARIGSGWIRSLRSAILLVPSVIVPEEHVALVNPAHADAAHIAASVTRPFEYHRLFRRG